MSEVYRVTVEELHRTELYIEADSKVEALEAAEHLSYEVSPVSVEYDSWATPAVPPMREPVWRGGEEGAWT